MYNHNKAQQSKKRVHISWDILYSLTSPYASARHRSEPINKNIPPSHGRATACILLEFWRNLHCLTLHIYIYVCVCVSTGIGLTGNIILLLVLLYPNSHQNQNNLLRLLVIFDIIFLITELELCLEYMIKHEWVSIISVIYKQGWVGGCRYWIYRHYIICSSECMSNFKCNAKQVGVR